MTAASIIVREKSAYLLTDTAGYAADGTIIMFHRKVVTSNRLRLAISTSGLVTSNTNAMVTEYLDRHDDTERAAKGLAALVSEIETDALAARSPGDFSDGLPAFVRVHAVAFSMNRQRAAGFVCASADEAFPGYTAGTVRGVAEALSPPIGRQAPQGFDGDPAGHGRAILAAQRDHAEAVATFVGGDGELTTVGAAGVSTRTLIRWPDRVGERISL